jgi:hypothetical protein
MDSEFDLDSLDINELRSFNSPDPDLYSPLSLADMQTDEYRSFSYDMYTTGSHRLPDNEADWINTSEIHRSPPMTSHHFPHHASHRQQLNSVVSSARNCRLSVEHYADARRGFHGYPYSPPSLSPCQQNHLLHHQQIQQQQQQQQHQHHQLQQPVPFFAAAARNSTSAADAGLQRPTAIYQTLCVSPPEVGIGSPMFCASAQRQHSDDDEDDDDEDDGSRHVHCASSDITHIDVKLPLLPMDNIKKKGSSRRGRRAVGADGEPVSVITTVMFS